MATVSQAPNWNAHHHDDNGGPATGWTVHTFRSHTEDYYPSYSDPEGTILHSPVIILDARGEYPGQGLYLVNGESYTLELRNTFGAAVKTVHNVTGVGGTGGSGGGSIVLPAGTVLGNVTAGSAVGYPVTIVNNIAGAQTTSIVNVAAVNTALEGYLPDHGTNTYDGNLNITGGLDVTGGVSAESVDATTVALDGISIRDIFIPIADHGARTLIGNVTNATADATDIAIANDLSSNSTDIIPSVAAVVDGIADAITALPDADHYTVKTSSADTLPSYLINKIQGSSTITVTNDGEIVTLEAVIPDPVIPALDTDSFSAAGGFADDLTGTGAIFSQATTWIEGGAGYIDTNPNFDLNSGIFTASSTGKYLFTFNGQVIADTYSTPSVGARMYGVLAARLYTSGNEDITPIYNREVEFSGVYPLGSYAAHTITGCVIFDMVQGQYVRLWARGQYTVINSIVFSGHSLTGVQGADGEQGLPGVNGVNGQNGINGTNGTNGTNGIDGIDGVDGTNGVDGTDGATGATGATGAPGAKGDKGDTGEPGEQGPPGSAGAATASYILAFNNVSSQLSAGILTVTHNLGTQFNQVIIIDDNNQEILPTAITLTSTTSCTVDLSGYTVSGTWRCTVLGAGGTSTTTLQQAYSNSVTPEITTADGQGALSLKRGTDDDTDDVLDIQNGAGAITAKITGAGEISGNGATLAGLTASQIVATDANKKLQTLAVATYPSLTQLSYVKGVTSAIQTQLNAKGAGTVTSVTGTAPVSVATGTTTPVISMAAATDSVPGYLTAADHTTFAAKQASLTLTTTGTSGAATLVGATLNIPQYAGGSSGGGSSFTKEYYYATTAGTSLTDYYAMKMKSLDASPSWDTSGWSAGLSGFKGKVMLPFAATSFNISFRLRLYNSSGATWNAGSTIGMRVAFVPLNYYNSGTPVASATMNYTIVNQVPTGYAVNDVDASFQSFTAQSISLTAGQIYGVSLYSTGTGVQTALGECAMSIEYKGA